MVTTLKMMPVTEAVSIPLRQALDPGGRLVPTAAVDETAAAMLDELLRLTAAFATVRTPA